MFNTSIILSDGKTRKEVLIVAGPVNKPDTIYIIPVDQIVYDANDGMGGIDHAKSAVATIKLVNGQVQVI